mgnify:CR=1 FL=1
MGGGECRSLSSAILPRSVPCTIWDYSDLDGGESEAIALAIELSADLILIDERKGTEAARRLGLTTIGVLGVLLEANVTAVEFSTTVESGRSS